jgi:ribonuclease T2
MTCQRPALDKTAGRMFHRGRSDREIIVFRRLALLAAPLLALIAAAPALAQNERRTQPGDFDLYVLALSWSPTYCLTDGARRGGGDPQCAADRPRAFVVHGLWPQFERGWPEFCQGQNPPRVPDGTINRMLDIMPSRGLVIHQWRKHGTCSGLQAQVYFDTTRRAFERIVIPERFRSPQARPNVTVSEVEAAFVAANPGLSADMMTVTCQQGMLDEVRVCLSRTLTPRRCAEVDSRACRSTMRLPGAGGRGS